MAQGRYCNCCGKELLFQESNQNDGQRIALEDYVTIDKLWGYFSGRDGIHQRVNVCEDCFQAWLATFARVPEEWEERELL